MPNISHERVSCLDGYEDDKFRVQMRSMNHGMLIMFRKAAYLEFELVPSGDETIGGGTIMDMQHVYVPEDERGQGLAREIVQKGFDLAAFFHYAVKPTCSYVSDTFLPKCTGLSEVRVELIDYDFDDSGGRKTYRAPDERDERRKKRRQSVLAVGKASTLTKG